jgi:predicted nucleic acid-binding protein
VINLVIDASLAAAWFLPDEQNVAADAILARLAEDNAFVPALWHLEVRNLIVMAERRARLTPDTAADALRLIEECPIVTDHATDLTDCMKLAQGHQLTFYDAVYLELSVRRKIPIATSDKALMRAALQFNLLLDLS